MALPRVSALAMFGLAAVYGCYSGDGQSPVTPVVETPVNGEVAPTRVDLSRGRSRAPRPYVFQALPGGYVAHQERDVATFTESGMKIEDAESGESIVLGTEYVGRDRNLWIGPPDESLDNDGAVVITRGNLIERFKPFRRATMQSWHFETQPSGAGDLRVRVNVGNAVSAQETADGVKILTATTAFLYEVATWVDANDTRTVIMPKWNGSAIEITVPAAVLGASTYPAMLDPLSGPFPSPQTLTPAYSAAVGYDSVSNGYLVAWEDYSTANGGNTNASRILARRYTSAGAALDATPLSLLAIAGSSVQGEPSVAFDGTNYVVAFWDASTSRNRVNVVRVRPADGAVSPATKFGTKNSRPSEYTPSIACKTLDCGVGFNVTRDATNAKVGFASVVTSATWATASTIRGPSRLNASAIGATVATDGTNYFLAWEQGAVGTAQVAGVRVVPGTTSDTFGTIKVLAAANIGTATGGEAYGPSVAYSGVPGKYVVAFSRYTATNGDDVKSVVATAGATTTIGAEADIKSGPSDQDNVAIACRNGSCLATVWESSVVWGIPINGVGNATSVPVRLNTVTSGYRENPRVAAGATNFFAVWSDRRASDYQIWGTAASTLGSPSGEALLSKP